MKIVYKYPIAIHGKCVITMPVGAKILSVDFQNGRIVLWALVDNETEVSEHRRFMSLMTGEQYADIDINPVFIGTVQIEDETMPNGKFVIHVFEEK
jgi:hypothetical protein